MGVATGSSRSLVLALEISRGVTSARLLDRGGGIGGGVWFRWVLSG